MAAATNETQCTTCEKGRAILPCEECSQSFCRIHLLKHRQQLCQPSHITTQLESSGEYPNINIKWIQNGRAVAGGNQLGEPLGFLCR